MTAFRMCFSDRHRRVDAPAARVGVSPAEYEARRRAGEKWCPRCGSWVPVDDFTRNRSSADGYGSMCRDCKREYTRAYARRRRRCGT